MSGGYVNRNLLEKLLAAVRRHARAEVPEVEYRTREEFMEQFLPEHTQEANDIYDETFRDHPVTLLKKLEESVAKAIRSLDDKLETTIGRIEVMLAIENKTVLTVSEAAKLANASSLTVRRWLEKGILRGSKSGDNQQARWFIRKRDLNLFLTDRANQGKSNS